MRTLKYWLPVVVWMVLIFAGSTDILSTTHTSRFLLPLIKWLFPGIDPALAGEIQFYVRKAAHVSEYGVLSLLVWNALAKPFARHERTWNWCVARRALLITALYAATDEFHQSFVPSRGSSAEDVAIDTCGAVIALTALYVLGRWRKWW